jgi:hypothetical protein
MYRFLLFFCALMLVSACSVDTGGFRVVDTQKENQPEAAAVPQFTAVDTLRALAPPEGLKVTPLFDKPVKNSNARIQRLEAAVQMLRDDLDTVVVPVVTRIAAPAAVAAPAAPVVQQQQTPSGMPQSLMPVTLPASQLQAAPAPQVVMPVSAVPQGNMPVPGQQAPSAPGMIGAVKGIRFADDTDKTRIVLDMTADSGLTAKTENNGKTLIISLPKMNWLGPKSWDADNAQLISGYRVDNGTIYINLMYAAYIKAQDVLPPNPKNADYRLMVDLFSPEVHKP